MSNSESGNNGIAIGLDGGVRALKFAVQSGEAPPRFYDCAGANPTLIGMNDYVSRLSQGILDALGSAQCSPEQVTSAGFGLSGVDRTDEIEQLQKKLGLVLPNCKQLWVGNDALPALRQGAGTLRGLVLIAGTGSICYAVATDGRRARVGGWGGELGDEGSGFWIGLRGLQAVCRMADGRLPKSPLLQAILEKIGVTSPEQLIPWSAAKTRGEFKAIVSSLYPLVAEHAAAGDQSAKQALLLAVGHLIQHVLAAETHLFRMENEELIDIDTETRDESVTQAEDAAGIAPKRRIPLVCAGGLLIGDQNFYETFVFQLRRKRDVFTPIRLAEPASLGALALGREAPVPA